MYEYAYSVDKPAAPPAGCPSLVPIGWFVTLGNEPNVCPGIHYGFWPPGFPKCQSKQHVTPNPRVPSYVAIHK